MAGVRRNSLKSLYWKARAGDDQAWITLMDATFQRLSRLVRTRGAALQGSDVEAICLNAYDKVAPKLEAIPTWPQAWKYLKKAALSLARTVLKPRHGTAFNSIDGARVADPASGNAQQRIEFFDTLDAFLENLDSLETRILLALIERDVRFHDRPQKLEDDVGLGRRQIQRRQRYLQDSAGEWYAGQSVDHPPSPDA